MLHTVYIDKTFSIFTFFIFLFYILYFMLCLIVAMAAMTQRNVNIFISYIDQEEIQKILSSLLH